MHKQNSSSQGTLEQKRPQNTTVKYSYAVEFYNDGIRLVAPVKGGKNKESGKHLRGEIKGWSKSSRRRMRAFMMTNRLPPEFELAAVTLTIPGYPLNPDQSQAIFSKWRNHATKNGWPCIWRVEIQKRGQLHWHCIVGVEKSLYPDSNSISTDICKSWHKCMSLMGEIEYRMVGDVREPTRCDFVTGRRRLMDWRGAEKYSCRVDLMKDQEAGWKRYLFDHTTKAKQEQIPENIGRHWGVVFRKAFIETLPTEVSAMTPREYAKFLRCLNRWFTPYLKDSNALFGRRRGFTVRRGKMGKTDLFTKSLPDVNRLVAWAVS